MSLASAWCTAVCLNTAVSNCPDYAQGKRAGIVYLSSFVFLKMSRLPAKWCMFLSLVQVAMCRG